MLYDVLFFKCFNIIHEQLATKVLGWTDSLVFYLRRPEKLHEYLNVSLVLKTKKHQKPFKMSKF